MGGVARSFWPPGPWWTLWPLWLSWILRPWWPSSLPWPSWPLLVIFHWFPALWGWSCYLLLQGWGCSPWVIKKQDNFWLLKLTFCVGLHWWDRTFATWNATELCTQSFPTVLSLLVWIRTWKYVYKSVPTLTSASHYLSSCHTSVTESEYSATVR